MMLLSRAAVSVRRSGLGDLRVRVRHHGGREVEVEAVLVHEVGDVRLERHGGGSGFRTRSGLQAQK